MYTTVEIAQLQAQKEATVAREAALETAQAAEQQLRQQLSSSSSSGAALREAQAESESLRQQLEESARKYTTVKQARERAMTEVIDLETIPATTGKPQSLGQAVMVYLVSICPGLLYVQAALPVKVVCFM